MGDEVLGFTNDRASHAEFVVVPADQLTPKPPAVSWEAAGGLFVAGTTAYAAVRSIELTPGDTVAIAGAAGGVGTIAVQLAKRTGATVLGIAGPSNDEWLAAHGVIPVNYGDGLAGRLRAAAPDGRVDALLDFFGGGYVELAVTELGIAPQRIDTVIDFPALERFGVMFVGNQDAADAAALAELAALIAAGQLEVPIAKLFRSTRSSAPTVPWNGVTPGARSSCGRSTADREPVRARWFHAAHQVRTGKARPAVAGRSPMPPQRGTF